LVLRHRLIRMIDEADGPWDTLLPRDESTPLQCLDHLIHGGCRDEEVTPDVYFSWGNTEPEDVPCDELEILPLTAGGLTTAVEASSSRIGEASEGDSKPLLK
jgi:hypothetical protein